MVETQEGFSNPPSYPEGGSYGDLLNWHLTVWGTHPMGSTNKSGPHWNMKTFAVLVHEDGVKPESADKNLRNWRNPEGAPPDCNFRAERIEEALFGDNHQFERWKNDLRLARESKVAAKASLLDAGFDPNQLVQPNSSWEIGTQGGSRLDLRAAILTARSRLILIAQNHWFLMSAEKAGNLVFWPLLTGAMTRGVDIDIIAMHPEISSSGLLIAAGELPEPDAIALWSLYMGAPQIGHQIDACWTTFAEWNDMYKEFSAQAESPVGNLRIFGAYFTPLTMTIVDPDEDDGYLVLSPRTPNNKSVARPQFEIHKLKEPYAFGYYYGDVQFQLVNDFWVKIYG